MVGRFREPILRIAGVRGAFAETAFMTRHYGVVAKAIHPNVRMGHVHLKVADLERALGFYRDVLGFELTQRSGSSAAFLSAGGYHHHIGLNTWESEGSRPPAEGTTGLYHLAILYPTRAELGDALRRLQKAGVPLEGASDHGVSEALYLRDSGRASFISTIKENAAGSGKCSCRRLCRQVSRVLPPRRRQLQRAVRQL